MPLLGSMRQLNTPLVHDNNDFAQGLVLAAMVATAVQVAAMGQESSDVHWQPTVSLRSRTTFRLQAHAVHPCAC